VSSEGSKSVLVRPVAFSGVFLLAIQLGCFVISGPCAMAQATVAFQNFFLRSDGTNFWRED